MNTMYVKLSEITISEVTFILRLWTPLSRFVGEVRVFKNKKNKMDGKTSTANLLLPTF